MITIKFYIYRKELIEKSIQVENYHEIRFLLENEKA